MPPSLPIERSITVTSKHDLARGTILALLARRGPEMSICPSEVARSLAASVDGADGAPDRWRDEMPVVHAAVDTLLDEGIVRLSWKGQPLATRSGPYRIRDARR